MRATTNCAVHGERFANCELCHEEAVLERNRLRQALRNICQEVLALLSQMTPEQRRHVDGAALVRLCSSVGYLQEIARKALEREGLVGEALEITP